MKVEPALEHRDGNDWMVLSASTRSQAEDFQRSLETIRAHGGIPETTSTLVIPDHGDRRIGSGGSTFWILFELAQSLLKSKPKPRSFANLFANERIMIVHCGGESRRFPFYAAYGKVFIPMPVPDPRGCAQTILELIRQRLQVLQVSPAGSVLVASGDTVLDIRRPPARFEKGGIRALALRDSIERGSRHGVYVSGPRGRVMDVLQKPDAQQVQSRGAVDRRHRLLIDTGILSFDPAGVDALMKAAGFMIRRGRIVAGAGVARDVTRGRIGPVDLYEHVTKAMASRSTVAGYIQDLEARHGRLKSHERSSLSEFHRKIHGQKFFVDIADAPDFMHVGSPREMLDEIRDPSRIDEFGFSRHVGLVSRSSRRFGTIDRHGHGSQGWEPQRWSDQRRGWIHHQQRVSSAGTESPCWCAAGSDPFGFPST